jgi:transposase
MRSWTGRRWKAARPTQSASVEQSRLRPALAGKGDVTLALCWAHLRRRFYQRAVAEASPIANEALQHIAALYRIEADIRGCAPDTRRAVRQERSRPLLTELEPWLRERLTLLSRKSKLAQAIRYGFSHWDGLARFLDDGQIEIDSNTVEQSIRPLALNRENALFAGSDGGGENWAIIAWLIETCKLNGVDPYEYPPTRS